MATYKVLQDIEAEDKLIGPLTLRQFIYGLAAAFNGYLTFLVITNGLPFMTAVFLPLTLAAAFFAWPWSRDQPTEVWALAKIRFLVKPRKRIWNQSGIKELVTITAPKVVEQIFTNGLSQNEVRSRLRTLAGTIDSRGWTIKHVGVNAYGQPSFLSNDAGSDRLISSSSLPQPVPTIDARAAEDMLDTQNSPVAHQFDNMITASTKAHHQSIMNRMQGTTKTPLAPPPIPAQPMGQEPANDYWFLSQPNQTTSTIPQDAVTFNTQVVAPGSAASDLPVAAANPTPYEESFIKRLDMQPTLSPNAQGHLNVIQPLSAQNPAAATQQKTLGNPQPLIPSQPPLPGVTQQPNAAILDLARNDDLNVATIAREAYKRKGPPQDEGIIFQH